MTHRKGQCVAAVDGGHVEDLAGLALQGQVQAKLRQECLRRSFSVDADSVSPQQPSMLVSSWLGACSEPIIWQGVSAGQAASLQVHHYGTEARLCIASLLAGLDTHKHGLQHDKQLTLVTISCATRLTSSCFLSFSTG